MRIIGKVYQVNNNEISNKRVKLYYECILCPVRTLFAI